jgi:hypothetical protein
MRSPQLFLPALLVFALALASASAVPAWAQEQQPAPPPPPADAALPPPFVEQPPPPPAEPAMAMPAASVPAPATGTDHDQVVGRWGVEARRLATLQKTPNQDRACKDDCPVEINSLALRRWSTSRYAWSAGLALGLGSGSTRTSATTKYTWDTYLGIGPTIGATFLLANWKHLAVGLSPQIDLLYFMPGSKKEKPKTLLLNVRGLIEGELHLGFLGLPQVSLGLATGLVIGYRNVSSAGAAMTPTGTSSEWAIGFAGPQSLWGLVTNMHLRFYF